MALSNRAKKIAVATAIAGSLVVVPAGLKGMSFATGGFGGGHGHVGGNNGYSVGDSNGNSHAVGDTNGNSHVVGDTNGNSHAVGDPHGEIHGSGQGTDGGTAPGHRTGNGYDNGQPVNPRPIIPPPPANPVDSALGNLYNFWFGKHDGKTQDDNNTQGNGAPGLGGGCQPPAGDVHC
jgi:hypothetical protein